MMISEELPSQSSITKTPVTSATSQAYPSHVTVAVGKEQQAQEQKGESWRCDEESDGGTSPVDDEPVNSVPQLQRWNSPRINMFRTMATFWDFMILGANDAAYGRSSRAS